MGPLFMYIDSEFYLKFPNISSQFLPLHSLDCGLFVYL